LSGPIAVPFIVGGVAAALQLDRKEVGQLLLSTPVVAAPLLGWLLGEPLLGLRVGLAFGLLWVAGLNEGSYHNANDTLAASICVGGALLAGGGDAGLAICVLLAAPFVEVGRALDKLRKNLNVDLAAKTERGLAQGSTRAVTRALFLGLGRSALPAGVVACLGTLAVGYGTPWCLELLPEQVLKGLAFLPKALPAVGAGVVLALLPGWSPAIAFAASAALGVGALTLGGGLL
jgi:PTS system mannose-specific IIC component